MKKMSYISPEIALVKFQTEPLLTPSGNESGIIPRVRSAAPSENELKNIF